MAMILIEKIHRRTGAVDATLKECMITSQRPSARVGSANPALYSAGLGESTMRTAATTQEGCKSRFLPERCPMRNIIARPATAGSQGSLEGREGGEGEPRKV